MRGGQRVLFAQIPPTARQRVLAGLCPALFNSSRELSSWPGW